MTPERKAAIQAVEDALQELGRVVDAECGDDPFGGVMTGWVAVMARTRIEDDGVGSSSVRLACPETLPLWQMVGLLRSAGMMAESDYMGMDRE